MMSIRNVLVYVIIFLLFVIYIRLSSLFVTRKENFESRRSSATSTTTSSTGIPKKIFTYWNEKDITHPVIKANLEYTRSILPSGFELIVLNDESVKEELGEDVSYDQPAQQMNPKGVHSAHHPHRGDLSAKADVSYDQPAQSAKADVRYKEHDMSTPQNFSDFLRFYLLRKYGGVWMDASYIIIDFDKDILSKYRDYEAQPFDIGLYEFKNQTFGEKPYEKHYESWFLIAPKGSAYVEDVYQEFVKASTMGYRAYKAGLRREPGLDLRNTIQAEDEYYFMVYAIMRHVLHRRGDANPYPMKIYSFEKVIYDKWHGDELVAKLTDPNVLHQYTSIKLIHNQREALAKSGKTPYLFHLLQKLNSS